MSIKLTSEQEQQIMNLVAQNKRYSEIAAELKLPPYLIAYTNQKNIKRAPKCKVCEMLLSSKYHQENPC